MRKGSDQKQGKDIVYGFPGRHKESNRGDHRTKIFPMLPTIPKLQAHLRKPEKSRYLKISYTNAAFSPLHLFNALSKASPSLS